VNDGHFPPQKRLGILLHLAILLGLCTLSTWGMVNLIRSQVGPNFIIFLLDSIFAFLPVPLFAYRTYALWRSDYILDRDSLEIKWGLRNEDIPLSNIEWVRPVSDLTAPLRLPWLPLPGAILGLRRHPDLGVVEFIASSTVDLLLVGTARRVYAISPGNATDFVRTFARIIEMGSLMPAEPKSVFPSFIFTRAWDQAIVRFLWLIGIFLNVGLVIWVSLIIPGINQVSLGFTPSGAPAPPSPGIQLIILPIVSSFLFITGLIAGLYYYRWEDHRVLAISLWASSALTSLLFLLAMLFVVVIPK
jgi:hypothetical protein